MMSKNVTPLEPVHLAHTRRDRMGLARGYMARMCDLANEGGQLADETLRRLQRGPGLRLKRGEDGVYRVVGEPIGLLDETQKDREATLRAARAARGAAIPGVQRASALVEEPVTEIPADVTENADVTKKRGRPRKPDAMTPTERKRAERDRKKAERAQEEQGDV